MNSEAESRTWDCITAAGEGSAVAIAINTDLGRHDIAAADRPLARANAV
jgi:hypothetical protein